MPEVRVQSLFEPNTANRGQDSPISHSWGATLPLAANEVREGNASAARLRLVLAIWLPGCLWYLWLVAVWRLGGCLAGTCSTTCSPSLTPRRPCDNGDSDEAEAEARLRLTVPDNAADNSGSYTNTGTMFVHCSEGRLSDHELELAGTLQPLVSFIFRLRLRSLKRKARAAAF
eukprot:scaffold102368_cov57-Phaeocystis_antarctica.AAC.1